MSSPFITEDETPPSLKKTKKVKKSESSGIDETIDEVRVKAAKGQQRAATASPQGLNWTALGFLALMIIPALATAAISISDYLYPQGAQDRLFRDRLVKCYSVANPKKLGEIDRILNKAKGKERGLFASLSEKYHMHPQCIH